MRRPDYHWTHHSLPKILNSLQNIIDEDCAWLEKQYEDYNGKDTSYRTRIDHHNTRYELMKELMCRLQSFHIQIVLSAIDQAFEESEKKGCRGNFKILITFDETPKPTINIIL